MIMHEATVKINLNLKKYYLNSAPPGSVRHLTCTYDSLEEEHFKCSWLAPTALNGALRYYKIQVKLGDQLIYSDVSRNVNYKKRLDLHLAKGENYEVVVSVMTHSEGLPSSTKMNFINSGELSDILLIAIFALNLDNVGIIISLILLFGIFENTRELRGKQILNDMT